MMEKIEFYCDTRRHFVCKPYSIKNLHWAAKQVGIPKWWFDKDHYDLPVHLINHVTSLCKVVTSKEILDIIGGGRAEKRKQRRIQQRIKEYLKRNKDGER